MIYTFSTFPHLEQLQQIFPEVFVLKSIKLDLKTLFTKIEAENPKYILGVAISSRKTSSFVPQAVNIFHSIGAVIPGEKFVLSLQLPNISHTPFSVSQKSSTSFCNYSMYRIQYFLNSKNLKIPFSFCHITKQDISKLSALNFT